MDEAVLKALVHRAHGIVVAEVPLAVDAGAVVGGAQEFCDGHFFGVHHGPAHVGVDAPCAIVVTAGHQAGASRRAHRADIKLGEEAALFGHGIQRGGADDFIAHEPVVASALIIAHDHDHIGPFGLCGGGVDGEITNGC